jgi:hypothetical protein
MILRENFGSFDDIKDLTHSYRLVLAQNSYSLPWARHLRSKPKLTLRVPMLCNLNGPLSTMAGVPSGVRPARPRSYLDFENSGGLTWLERARRAAQPVAPLQYVSKYEKFLATLCTYMNAVPAT